MISRGRQRTGTRFSPSGPSVTTASRSRNKPAEKRAPRPGRVFFCRHYNRNKPISTAMSPGSVAAQTPEPFLRREGVRKTFGRFTALETIGLAVERGELVTFLGPSGCGKTTLLRIIAGLATQDAGT